VYTSAENRFSQAGYFDAAPGILGAVKMTENITPSSAGNGASPFIAGITGTPKLNYNTYAGYFVNNAQENGSNSLNYGLYVSGNNNYFSGKVGIGTLTPSQMLDVRGIGNFSGTIYINNNTDISSWASNISTNWTLYANTYTDNKITAINNTANIWSLISGIFANVAWKNQTNVFTENQNFSKNITIDGGSINLNNNATITREGQGTKIFISETGNVVTQFGN